MTADVLQRLLEAARGIPTWMSEPPPEALADLTCPYPHDHGCPDEDCALFAYECRQVQVGRSSWAELQRLVAAYPEVVDAVPGLRAAVAACGDVAPEEARRALIRQLADAAAPVGAQDPDSWVGAKDAARTLGVTERTLRRWRDAGSGPAFSTVGRAIRYRVGDVQAWIDAQKVGSSAERAARGR